MMDWEMKHPRFYVLVLLVQMLRIKHLDTWLALIIQLKLIMGSGFKHSYLDEVFAYAYRVMLCGRDCFFFILLINCQLLCVWICCLYCFYEKHIVTFCLIMEKLCWLIVFDFLLFFMWCISGLVKKLMFWILTFVTLPYSVSVGAWKVICRAPLQLLLGSHLNGPRDSCQKKTLMRINSSLYLPFGIWSEP